MSTPYVVDTTTFMVPAGSLVVLFVGLVGSVVWLWSLVDVLRIDDRTWSAVGQSKLVWVVVIVLLSLLGSILYVAIARRALRSVSV